MTANQAGLFVQGPVSRLLCERFAFSRARRCLTMDAAFIGDRRVDGLVTALVAATTNRFVHLLQSRISPYRGGRPLVRLELTGRSLYRFGSVSCRNGSGTNWALSC